MPIDFEHERIIPLARVPELPFIPPRRRGSRLSPSTVWRWVRDGRLETALVGGHRVTSIEAVLRFLESTAGAPRPRGAPIPTLTTTTRDAERESERLGL